MTREEKTPERRDVYKRQTLYMTTHYQDMMPRINTDEILREFGDWRNTSDLMKAVRIAVERLNSYLSAGRCV